MRSVAHRTDCAFFTSYKDLQMRYEKNHGQMQNKPFLIVIYHSSLVKAAMNPARICKCTIVLTKRLNFFFQWPKAEQRL